MRTKLTQADVNAGNASRSIREKQHVRHLDIYAETVDKEATYPKAKYVCTGNRQEMDKEAEYEAGSEDAFQEEEEETEKMEETIGNQTRQNLFG